MATTKKYVALPGVTQIKTANDLYSVAYNTMLRVIDRLPAVMSFNIIPKSTWTLADGRRKAGYYAVLEITIINKRGTRVVLDDVLLGQITKPLSGPTSLNAGDVASALQKALTEQTNSYLPPIENTQPAPSTPAPQPAPSTPAPPSGGSQTPPPAAQPAPAPTPSKPSAASFFQSGEAYKYPNNATVYIFFSGQLHGVVGPNAYAKYYGKTWDGKTDLNTIHPIQNMPDLTSADVPSNFFNGSLIQ